MTHVGDLLLRWASENDAGVLREMLKTVEWTCRKYRLQTSKGAAGRWVRNMSALGYLDVDWRGGSWSVAPTVLTRIPSSGGILFLTGARNRAVEDRIEDMAEVYECLRIGSNQPEGNVPVPQSVFYLTDPDTDCSELASELASAWVPCFATQVTKILPLLELGPETSPPMRGAPLKWFDPDKRRYEDVLYPREEGIYRFKTADQRQLVQVFKDGSWRASTHEEALYLGLDRPESAEESVIRWLPESSGSPVGRLVVDWDAPLPPLHARAAVLSSGLSPWVSIPAETICYDNVSLPLAAVIAKTLRQILGVLPVPESKNA